MLESYGSWIRLGLSVGGVLVFLFFELIVPYRPSTVSKVKRWAINLGMTAMNSILLTVVFAGAIISVAAYAGTEKAGLLNMADMPQWFRVLATLAFMDLMLYIWHLLNHEMPLLWRFHRVQSRAAGGHNMIENVLEITVRVDPGKAAVLVDSLDHGSIILGHVITEQIRRQIRR